MTEAAAVLSLDDQAQLLDEQLTRACETSFRTFLREAWPHFDPEPFRPNWHLDAMCDFLQALTRGVIQNGIINIPPRNGKTSLVSIAWFAWEWGPANLPTRKAIFTSYGTGLALDSAVKCRRLMQSQWYQRRWGHRFAFTSDQNAKGKYENDKGGVRFSSSFESGITGQGGSLFVVDDPLQLDDDENDEKIQHVIDQWDGTISSRLNNPDTASRLIIMQRLNERDLTGHVLEQAKQLKQRWHHMMLPAEYEPDRRCRIFVHEKLFFEDPRRKDGELLNPVRFNADAMADLKVISGSYRYAGRFQQRPAPKTGGIFQRGWWRYWTVLPGRFEEYAQSWDMTFGSKGQDASYVVGQVWGKLGAFRYLLDQVRGKMTFPETVDAVEALSAKWPQARLKLIEQKANGQAVIDSLHGRINGIVGVKVTEDKPARARAVSPDVESGNVYLPHPSVEGKAWVSDFVEETAVFPRSARNDQVDAMTQLLNRWHPGADDSAVAVIKARR